VFCIVNVPLGHDSRISNIRHKLFQISNVIFYTVIYYLTFVSLKEYVHTDCITLPLLD